MTFHQTRSDGNWLPLQAGIVFANRSNNDMLKKLRELYKEYKPYVRVDLIMYATLILMIFLYLIISVLLRYPFIPKAGLITIPCEGEVLDKLHTQQRQKHRQGN